MLESKEQLLKRQNITRNKKKTPKIKTKFSGVWEGKYKSIISEIFFLINCLEKP